MDKSPGLYDGEPGKAGRIGEPLRLRLDGLDLCAMVVDK